MAAKSGADGTRGKGLPAADRRARGFAPASDFVAPGIGAAAARFGHAGSRLASHWEEIVGPELAALCRPLRLSRGPGGFGGTLTVSVTPGRGPEVSLAAPAILERVNAACGPRSVARLRLAQAGPPGLAEAAARFRPPAPPAPLPAAEIEARAETLLSGIPEGRLRDALAAFARGLVARGRRTG